MLAGLLKAPSKYAPHVNMKASRKRTREVITNMYEAGFITRSQANYSKRHLPRVNVRRITKNKHELAGYFLDWIFENIEHKVLSSGNSIVTIRTSLDLDIQKKAENVIRNIIRKYGRGYRVSEGAMVVMSKDGAILAMVGGVDYGQSHLIERLMQKGNLDLHLNR